jgi:hypothetical protein
MFGLAVLITAVVVVIATSVIKNARLSTRVNSLIAAAVSVVAGAVGLLALHGFDLNTLVTTDLPQMIVSVYGSATAVYHFILKGSPLNDALESVQVIPAKGIDNSGV